MTAINRADRSSTSRNWRGLLAVFVAVMYLLAGVVHGAHDIDVTSPAGGPEIASVLDHGPAGDSDHKAIGGHHCHGCFSVAVAQPLQSEAAADVVTAQVSQPAPALVGIALDMDSPPPKSLT